MGGPGEAIYWFQKELGCGIVIKFGHQPGAREKALSII
jgi:hypothetical protein